MVKRGDKDNKGDLKGPVHVVQFALRHHGAELNPDGDFGGITQEAVRRFQYLHNLTVTGEVDEITMTLLLEEPAKAPPVPPSPLPSTLETAPWLSVMRAITGTKEGPGDLDNPEILRWRDVCTQKFPELKPGMAWYKHDSTPWCGLGEAYVMAMSGIRPPLEPLYALNWKDEWKDGIRLKEPVLGATMVFHRQGGGHVGNYESEDAHHWVVRGCNQSDNVTKMAIQKDGGLRLEGIMWPKDRPVPTTGRVYASGIASTKVT